MQDKTHPDWIQLSGDELKMDELRTQLYQLRLKAFKAKKKVLSIDCFEACSTHIQNALLKTLEEPRQDWLIFLGAKNVSGLLPTILSRCLRYPLPPRQLEDALDANEKQMFNLITKAEAFELHSLLEDYLKTRDKAKELSLKLLEEASRQAYPGFWSFFAPTLEQESWAFDRNIHPKIIWEKAWNSADENR